MTTSPDPVRVMLIAEGTYPFHWGGVSTWCDLLLRGLPDVDFTLLSIAGNPRLVPQFNLPPNVTRFITTPLWGLCEVAETRRDLSIADLFHRKRRTTEAIVAVHFIPLFRSLLQVIFDEPDEPAQLGSLIHQLYRFFLAYDLDATLRSRAVWDCFLHTAQAHFPALAARHGYPEAGFTLSDVTTSLRWLYHWLFPIAQPLPSVDVIHAAMVGLSTLVALAAKLEYDAAYLLTEHGIYLRETYLAEAASSNRLFLKLFKIRFARAMNAASYALADQISPCCDYNQRWELRNGAPADRLQTIYYGADAARFVPADKPDGEPPTVVWVGRINPLKDLETLLRAAALVHQVQPDIRFKLFGNAAPEDAAYEAAMRSLHRELKLDGVVSFCGFVARPETAFRQGDIVVLSSISEAFPFSLLEAMLCGKPIAATAVGGVPEEVRDCGMAVEPRNPYDLAQAILTLLSNPDICRRLGRAARDKAARQFSLDRVSGAYRASYLRLSRRHAGREPITDLPRSRPPVEPVGDGLWPTTATDSIAGRGYEALRLAGDQRVSLRRPLAEVKAPDEAAIAAQAREISRRIPLPVDALEIAAVLESMGVTDEVAAQRYHLPDVFALAEVVLSQLRGAG